MLDAVNVLSRVERNALRQLAYAQKLRYSMPDFMRWAWPVDPSHRKPLDWNFHLDAICDFLTACKAGQIKRVIINVPPRTLKSWTVSVAFPAWWWSDDPSIQFLATSANKDVVLRDADMLRDLCASKEYQTMFRPDWDFRGTATGRQQDAKGNYRNSAGGHRISKAIGSKATGENADVVIFDDPLDASDAYTDKAALVAHVDHARQKFMTRLNDQETGVIIVIMQRLHELDLSGVLLADGGWEHLYLPAEFDGRRVWNGLGWEDPRKEEGELLFPKRLPKEFLDKMRTKELGSRGYAGQFQQQPAPASGAMVLKKWLHYWIPSELPEMTYTIGSWDCTYGSKTSDADFVVGQTWGVSGDNHYLLDQVRRKMNLPEMIEAIREQDREWPGLRAVVVERKAAGKDVIDTLSREVYALDPYDPQSQSKEQRLAATLPLWEQGRVYLPHPMHASDMDNDFSWVKERYVPELLTFPGARHDDQVDATSQALIWIMDNGPGDVMIHTIGGR
jgi:predicted phage terminase large subunit-like protein